MAAAKLIAIDPRPVRCAGYFRLGAESAPARRARFPLRGEFSDVLAQLGRQRTLRRADAILFDLGRPSRCRSTGPSAVSRTRTDAPLDMRMDPASELSARELVNEGRANAS